MRRHLPSSAGSAPARAQGQSIKAAVQCEDGPSCTRTAQLCRQPAQRQLIQQLCQACSQKHTLRFPPREVRRFNGNVRRTSWHSLKGGKAHASLSLGCKTKRA